MSGLSPRLRTIRTLLLVLAATLAVAVGVRPLSIQGQAEQLGSGDSSEPIWIQADFVQEWESGRETIQILRGNCRVSQGSSTWRSRSIVLWKQSNVIRNSGPVSRRTDVVTMYLEDGVRTERPGQTTSDPNLLVQLTTEAGLQYEVREQLKLPGDQDPLFDRAIRRRRLNQRQMLTQTQLFVEDSNSTPLNGPELTPFNAPAGQDEFRRVRIYPRSSRFFVESFKSTNTTPPEQVWVVKGGVNLLIDGISEVGVVDLSADRMVIWTQTIEEGQELQSESLQSRDTPFHVYMEGNIVIRQGQNVLRSSHAYYDAREDRALLLNAELKSYVPQLQGDIRIRAERIRQLSRKNFHAQRAWATASQFGKPGYRLEASDVFLDYRYQEPWVGLNGAPPVDPVTGAPLVEEVPWIQSLNNQFKIDEFPIFFAPNISAPADDPNVPIRRAAIEQDSIFGTQVRTVWDLSKLSGIELPRGVEWNLEADYLSKRGPGVGTSGLYEGRDLWGLPGSYTGRGSLYYIYDDGRDNLGLDRRELIPEDRNRGQARLEHRQELPQNMLLFGELGFVSDRNFLEQYHENEFDQAKDVETLLYLKQDIDNWSWSVLGRPQLNDYEVTTQWLPKLDLYGLSEPLGNGWLNWSNHTSIGYGRLRQADQPTDPNDLFTPIPYVADASGAVLMTRHELDAPFNLGALKLDPYVMGEAAYWGDDYSGNEADRLVGAAGIRASLMAWRVFPNVHNRILNLNGLAHKAVFKADYSFIDSSESYASIPQYNELDDNSQERFRERLATNTFGGVVPTFFEPRYYAIRSGAGNWVSAPYHELIDTQQVLRLSMRHRLQTKVGAPDRLRIRDFMIFDAGVSFFPKPERDNFDEDWGLLYGRYEWNISDRTKLLASGLYDFFEGGQEVWSLGALSQRSTRGSIYLGVRQIKGASLESQILTASYTYAMSPKWISTFGTAYDLAEGQNRGQSLTITRVGADFLFHVGASYDNSKDNAGIAIAIEPRFGPMNSSSSQLSNLLGLQ